jgi:hypothetical protein
MSRGLGAAAAPDSAPADSPESVLFEALTAAMVRTLGPRKSRAFLHNLTGELATRASHAETTPLRPRPGDVEKREAVRQAVTLYRGRLPTFCAALPWRRP